MVAGSRCISAQYHQKLQYIFSDSNIDGSFTVADLNAFLSPSEIHPITQEKKYWGIFREIF